MTKPPTHWERLDGPFALQVAEEGKPEPDPPEDQCACCGVTRSEIRHEFKSRMKGKLFDKIEARGLSTNDVYASMTLCCWCSSSVYETMTEKSRMDYFRLRDHVGAYLDTLPKCVEFGCEKTALWVRGGDNASRVPCRCDEHARRQDGLAFEAGSNRPLDPADRPMAGAEELRILLDSTGRK